MSSAISEICAVIVIVFTLLTPTASCAPTPSQQSPDARSPLASPSPQKPRGKDDRIAIPEIKGCARDQVTFYKGKALSFKRAERSVEITVRTEWDTTEKLRSEDSETIEFRVNGKSLKDEEWKTIENLLSDPSQQLGVTVWVCKPGDREQIKIIDWELPVSR